jgi:hypothetical protein
LQQSNSKPITRGLTWLHESTFSGYMNPLSPATITSRTIKHQS